jgi:hypothetical protein
MVFGKGGKTENDPDGIGRSKINKSILSPIAQP